LHNKQRNFLSKFWVRERCQARRPSIAISTVFVIAIEILAAAIRTSIVIKGIKLESEEWKIVQYADDLAAFLSDLHSVRSLFTLLDRFEQLSGLKVNYTKTEAMWIGSCRDNTETPLSLKWCKNVKALVHLQNFRLNGTLSWTVIKLFLSRTKCCL